MKKYEQLTKYISLIDLNNCGDWKNSDNQKSDSSIDFPYLQYNEIVYKFIEDVISFCDKHEEFDFKNYVEILKKAKIKVGSLSDVDITKHNEKTIVLMIFAAIRAERFCEGTLMFYIKDGTLIRWLKRLEEFDKIKVNLLAFNFNNNIFFIFNTIFIFNANVIKNVFFNITF